MANGLLSPPPWYFIFYGSVNPKPRKESRAYLFSWIGDIVEWLLCFFPRLVIIRTTNRAVKFKCGKKLVLVEPGLMMYWPLVTEVLHIAVVRQTINLPTQRLVTKDGKRVVASAVVVFTISDPIQAVGLSWDWEETIRDISMASVAAIITGGEYDSLVSTLSRELRVDLTNECRLQLKKYGIRVQKCLLTDFCPANVIALSNSDSHVFESGE